MGTVERRSSGGCTSARSVSRVKNEALNSLTQTIESRNSKDPSKTGNMFTLTNNLNIGHFPCFRRFLGFRDIPRVDFHFLGRSLVTIVSA